MQAQNTHKILLNNLFNANKYHCKIPTQIFLFSSSFKLKEQLGSVFANFTNTIN